MLKKSLKLMATFTCAVLLLCACAKESKYETIDIENVVGAEDETESETEEEVIQLVSLPPVVYVRVPVNLLIAPGKSNLGAFVERETKLTVSGYQGEDKYGDPVFYKVSDGENEGWIRSWYVTESLAEAKRPEIPELNEEGKLPEDQIPAEGTDAYYLAINSVKTNRWGGGDAVDADYYARDKEFKPNREMPERVKSLYLNSSMGGNDIDEFISIAKNNGINTFVINISDNQEIGYQSDVMKEFCPKAYNTTSHTREWYGNRIQKFRDEGFYLVGRITTFQDDFLAEDHPELTISDLAGNRKPLSNGFWPTPYSRRVWEYKIEVAKEAVEWFGFDEIQFDYVRFPDRTQSAEKEGDIDYHNEYNESKIQAIQRFLMYAVDQLHDCGVYVAADVFGEVSQGNVGGYGQYWAAMSNVVDVISPMPYTDHYEGTEDWKPWVHPYETVKTYADQVVTRQKECPTPAIVRTWIQGYNAYKEPHTEFYAENVGKEIQALYDAGLINGWMVWNGANSIKHARLQAECFSKEP